MSDRPPRPVDVFHRVAETYDQAGVDYFSVFGRRLVEIVGVRTGERVLDVGSGRGAVTFPAADAVGPTGRVTAIDLAPGMVERLRADVARDGLSHVDTTVMDAQDPDLPPSSFDVVLSSLVLFFLDDPQAALARYVTSLASDGRLGITTFGAGDPRWKWVEDMRSFSADEREATPPDRSRFDSTEKVDALVAGAGYVDVRSTIETHDIIFDDFDSWWSWSWSHGGRRVLDTIPADRLDDARAAAASSFAAIAETDGSAVLHQAIRYTTARRD